ncbi:MAG: hypothetical protein ACJAVK_000254 [Akkermansiaceae bacterium]|jgi:hypothetical protein
MKYKTVFVYAPLGVSEKSTFLSGTVLADSPYWVDGVAFASQTEAACNQLDDEGFEVVTITEVTRGSSESNPSGGSGWSVTHGVLITARRNPL